MMKALSVWVVVLAVAVAGGCKSDKAGNSSG